MEDSGFRTFVEALNPNYDIPTRQKIRYEILPALYEKAKNSLETILQNVESLALTTDLWTSLNLDSYLSLTIHFYHENMLKSFVLSTVCIFESHTAAHLATTLNTILGEWKIRDKIVAIVTDNATNMLKMCELLEIRNMPCFAHTLNLTVQDALAVEELEAIIEKCKKLVKFFKKSTLATNALITQHKDRQQDAPLKLIQEVATRWNSVFHMLNRILLLSDSLAIVTRKLSQAPPYLTTDEEKIIQEVVKILNIFEQATKLISAESYPTSSLVIPVICGLYDNINTLRPYVTTTIGIKFYEKVKESMNTRLLGYEIRTVNKIATYLHPMYRNGYRQTENMLSAKELVRRELIQCLRDNATPTVGHITVPPEPESPTSTTPSTDTPKLLDFLNKRKENSELAIPANASAINILKMYQETSCKIEQDMDVGMFWDHNKHLSPLGTIATRYLCVPATSVPSERLFSTAGYIVGSRRTRLHTDAVEMLCFLNRNRILIF